MLASTPTPADVAALRDALLPYPPPTAAPACPGQFMDAVAARLAALAAADDAGGIAALGAAWARAVGAPRARLLLFLACHDARTPADLEARAWVLWGESVDAMTVGLRDVLAALPRPRRRPSPKR